MKFTDRTAHMKWECPFPVGHILHNGDKYGYMGTTGQSTGEHVHKDVSEGWNDFLFRLSQMNPGRGVIPRPDQLLYFVEDDGLFGVPPIITTEYCDVQYWKKYHKQHYGLDIVPKGYNPNHDWALFWNRSKQGIILAKGFDPNGYGHWVNIGFET